MKVKTIIASAFVFVALILGAAASELWAEDPVGDEIPFDEHEIFFELNNTDGDLGIHSLIDGDAWERLRIDDPSGRNILDVKLKGRLRKQGLTESRYLDACCFLS